MSNNIVVGHLKTAVVGLGRIGEYNVRTLINRVTHAQVIAVAALKRMRSNKSQKIIVE
ncbi:hypothetical protein K505DRAFT_363239 [Melanomma pulvis-pyrius CBS 109.77]|uniref:Uncharacterized protein n=1 Tax=Melanomma pulvis-pyrius CBS 109.77 TaxID=1314802 RepID=A0A6A6X7J7_9PLEO|nr:hypothetical protein K505DRAFT_363239 [Melanomma pulvis-pyrius CBS 109.77]